MKKYSVIKAVFQYLFLSSLYRDAVKNCIGAFYNEYKKEHAKKSCSVSFN